MPAFNKFVAALAGNDQPNAAFAALEALTKDVLGVKLFTLTASDTTKNASERIYSNMPEVYPATGTKPYGDALWSDIVLKQRRTFVANTIADIAEVFADHQLIKSLACGSIINVPIVVDNEVIGTINCLNEAGYYSQDRLQAAEALSLPAAACLLLHNNLKKRSRK
ncbi:GAF domain-containing protein (plasmid) [Rhizobium sp. T1470]|uniref:GAF domain-containing protein n=1 Tax=unclassified Rhizobium TaxID=2613769 RepID=UPI001CD7732B|nr:GAF domain-containing protein [Rhizobium sp. T1473]MCA0806107.1 GAF domain-containing protein [Rhizobium sp. T1473]